MSFLFKLRGMVQNHVDRFGVRKPAKYLFHRMLDLVYGPNALIETKHNGKKWKLVRSVSLWDEDYEEKTVAWLRDVCKPGYCVMDVGANIGLISLEMASLVSTTGRVIAVEPAPGNIHILEVHLAANHVSELVKIVPAAVGATGGDYITLTVFGGSSESIGSGHTIRKHDLAHSGEAISTIRVPLLTIDSICKDHNFTPDVIKIDIEGAELDAVRGAMNVLRSSKPHLIIGFHPFAFENPEKATTELRELLQSVGYETGEPKNGSYKLEEYTFEGKNRLGAS